MMIMIMTMKQNLQESDTCTHPRCCRCNKSVDLRTGIAYDVHGTKRKNVTSCTLAREHRDEMTFLTLTAAKSNFTLPF